MILTVNHNTFGHFAQLELVKSCLAYAGLEGASPVIEDANPLSKRVWQTRCDDKGLKLELVRWDDCKRVLPVSVTLKCEYGLDCDHRAHSLPNTSVLRHRSQSWVDYEESRRKAVLGQYLL